MDGTPYLLATGFSPKDPPVPPFPFTLLVGFAHCSLFPLFSHPHTGHALGLVNALPLEGAIPDSPII